MILLDTNVLSEALRPRPAEAVLAWLASRPRSGLFTTAVTRAEIFYGVELLEEGEHRHALRDAVTAIFAVEFAGRVLGFDQDAADAYAAIASGRRKSGKRISQADAMIAAIACSRGASLATRNLRDFDDCGIDIVNPWSG